VTVLASEGLPVGKLALLDVSLVVVASALGLVAGTPEAWQGGMLL